ncbi:MAG: glycosyltransferase [Xanthobacteraceae bacterium]|nr:glycosyltransferase [Xanthobacteraceae bacterium]
MNPAVSVIIAVRNPGRFLEPALQSLADQTFTDYEAIIVDNGSDDGTGRILADWAAKDDRISVYPHRSIGLARCLNYGASIARAPLIARLDGDDILLPDRLAVQHARMSKDADLGLLGACVDLIDGEDRPLGRRRLPLADAELRGFLRTGNPFVHSTIMMRKAAFDAVGGYRVGLRLCEDFDLWCRIAAVTRIANCEEVLARYRIHESSMSAGRPIRLAIADTCIIAATRARESGGPEPFASGRPQLRRALAILDISRDEIRYRVLKTVVGVARMAMVRGDDQLARRLRARAYSVAWGLSFRSYGRGLARILASYFSANTRVRRKALVGRLFGS